MRTCDVYYNPVCSVAGKQLIHFQSRNPVFKTLRCSEDGALIRATAPGNSSTFNVQSINLYCNELSDCAMDSSEF